MRKDLWGLCSVWGNNEWSLTVLSSLLPLGVLASASPKCSMALVCCCCASSASCPAMAYMELVPSGYFFLRGEKKKKQRKTIQLHGLPWDRVSLLSQTTSKAACKQGKWQSFSKSCKSSQWEVLHLRLKCTYQLFPLRENENSYKKNSKYKVHWSWCDFGCWF